MVKATVGELKRLLADVPDNTLILAPSSDHSYRLVSGSVMDVAVEKAERGGRLFSEWSGNLAHYDGSVGVVKAVVIQ
jgi:hypothetical protein